MQHPLHAVYNKEKEKLKKQYNSILLILWKLVLCKCFEIASCWSYLHLWIKQLISASIAKHKMSAPNHREVLLRHPWSAQEEGSRGQNHKILGIWLLSCSAPNIWEPRDGVGEPGGWEPPGPELWCDRGPCTYCHLAEGQDTCRWVHQSLSFCCQVFLHLGFSVPQQ